MYPRQGQAVGDADIGQCKLRIQLNRTFEVVDCLFQRFAGAPLDALVAEQVELIGFQAFCRYLVDA